MRSIIEDNSDSFSAKVSIVATRQPVWKNLGLKRLTHQRLTHSAFKTGLFKTEALQNRGAFTLATTLACPAQRLLPIIALLEATASVHAAA